MGRALLTFKCYVCNVAFMTRHHFKKYKESKAHKPLVSIWGATYPCSGVRDPKLSASGPSGENTFKCSICMFVLMTRQYLKKRDESKSRLCPSMGRHISLLWNAWAAGRSSGMGPGLPSSCSGCIQLAPHPLKLPLGHHGKTFDLILHFDTFDTDTAIWNNI